MKNNAKKSWQYVNEKTKYRTGINSIEVNGKLTTDYYQITEKLNGHFSTVLTHEEELIPAPEEIVTSHIENAQITEETVLDKSMLINQ